MPVHLTNTEKDAFHIKTQAERREQRRYKGDGLVVVSRVLSMYNSVG